MVVGDTLGYAKAEELKRGARDLLGAADSYSPKKAPDLLIGDIHHTKCGIPVMESIRDASFEKMSVFAR